MSETVERPLGGVDITMETVLAQANMRAAWVVRESQRRRRWRGRQRDCRE